MRNSATKIFGVTVSLALLVMVGCAGEASPPQEATLAASRVDGALTPDKLCKLRLGTITKDVWCGTGEKDCPSGVALETYTVNQWGDVPLDEGYRNHQDNDAGFCWGDAFAPTSRRKLTCATDLWQPVCGFSCQTKDTLGNCAGSESNTCPNPCSKYNVGVDGKAYR